MIRFRSACLNLFKSATALPSATFRQSSIRLVHVEQGASHTEENNETPNLRLDNFEEAYSKIKLPLKMKFPENREAAKRFLRMRLEQFPVGGYRQLVLEDYRELYEHLQGEERDKLVADLSQVLEFYNKMRNSVFCPINVPVEDMRKMLHKYDRPGARLRYLRFMIVRDFDEWRYTTQEEEIKAEKKKKYEEELASFSQIGCFNEHGELQYGFWRNTLFGQHYKKSYMRYTLHNLRQAYQFGQRIVLDCSFDETMAEYETSAVARQLTAIYNYNRISPDPFHLLFCGFDGTKRGHYYTKKQMQALVENPGFFLNLHRETYQELLPGERLIYLSPDSRKIMTEFDPNAVYIIGALVSKTHKSKFTFEKARAEGIECLRLPIHQYVQLKPSVKKVLSFEGVFKILLGLKQHGDWERALREGIMKHKLVPKEEQILIKHDD